MVLPWCRRVRWSLCAWWRCMACGEEWLAVWVAAGGGVVMHAPPPRMVAQRCTMRHMTVATHSYRCWRQLAEKSRWRTG